VRINVTLTRVPVTIVAIENQEILHILSVCLQPLLLSMQAHEPYYIVTCDPSGSTIFFHINSQTAPISEKRYVRKLYFLILCITFFWNISHSKKNWATYFHKRKYFFVWSTRYSCHTLMKFELSPHTFKKYSNIKSNEDPPSSSSVFACGQADRQTWVT